MSTILKARIQSLPTVAITKKKFFILILLFFFKYSLAQNQSITTERAEKLLANTLKNQYENKISESLPQKAEDIHPIINMYEKSDLYACAEIIIQSGAGYFLAWGDNQIPWPHMSMTARIDDLVGKNQNQIPNVRGKQFFHTILMGILNKKHISADLFKYFLGSSDKQNSIFVGDHIIYFERTSSSMTSMRWTFSQSITLKDMTWPFSKLKDADQKNLFFERIAAGSKIQINELPDIKKSSQSWFDLDVTIQKKILKMPMSSIFDMDSFKNHDKDHLMAISVYGDHVLSGTSNSKSEILFNLPYWHDGLSISFDRMSEQLYFYGDESPLDLDKRGKKKAAKFQCKKIKEAKL